MKCSAVAVRTSRNNCTDRGVPHEHFMVREALWGDAEFINDNDPHPGRPAHNARRLAGIVDDADCNYTTAANIP